MRSHGVGDHPDKPHLEDDYVVKSYRTKPQAEGQKHSYFLRTNTNRFVSNRGGGGGGVKDHEQYQDHRDNTMSSSPSRGDGEYCASREEEDLANCLVMLSSNGSFVSSTHEEDENHNLREGNKAKEMEINNNNNNNNNNKGLFQCKACKKVFNSHQALGGHRASHKKVKGCYAAKLNNNNNNNNNSDDNDYYLDGGASVGPQHSDYSLPSPPSPAAATALSRKRSRVHQCSICHRIFSSGQALGGHKRCHWLASGMTEATLIQNFQEIAAYDHSKSPPLIFKNPAFMATPPPPHPSPLDLNFPPLLSQPAGDITKAAARKPETPTRSGYMKLWGAEELSTINSKPTNNTNYHNHHQNSRNNIKFADEKPKMKSPKLSDLKDLKLDGGSASGWLQMGIASSTPALI
nr:zinc finger protein ZAT4-like [Ipomoea batatas]